MDAPEVTEKEEHYVCKALKDKTPLYFCIVGNIAVGKTTLANALAEHLECNVVEEVISHHVFIGPYYKEPKKYAFLSQHEFLIHNAIKQLWIQKETKHGIVQDRCMLDVGVFSKVFYDLDYLTKKQYENICETLEEMEKSFKKPDFIIHLDCKPWLCEERMKERNRDIEAHVPYSFLTALHVAYHKKLKDYAIPVIRINWSEYHEPEYVISEIISYFQ
jgi:deoxyguanosine kinase